MIKFVIWGTGKRAQNNYILISKMEKYGNYGIDIIGFVDSNPTKWGTNFNSKIVFPPEMLESLDYDYIDIWVANSKNEISSVLTDEMKIDKAKIKDAFFLYKDKLLKVNNNQSSEIREIIDKICRDDMLKVFYQEPPLKERHYKVYNDEEKNFKYVIFEGKRLYLAKTFNRYEMQDGDYYISDIWYEQHANSPHLYEYGNIMVSDGDVLVDAGACEGNFSLHNIEKVKKLYIIECDNDWMNALHLTFEPYKEKVVFCKCFLSDKKSDKSASLDSLINEPVDFLKMDIEGEEINALMGAGELIKKSKRLKCAICSYHKHGDEQKIKEILESYDLHTETSKGYMLFIYDPYVLANPELRHGIVRGIKK